MPHRIKWFIQQHRQELYPLRVKKVFLNLISKNYKISDFNYDIDFITYTIFLFDIVAKMENNDNSGVDTNNSRITYTYPMVKETDMTESMKADVST